MAEESDLLIQRAKQFLRQRVQKAHQLAESDLTTWLRNTKSAGTDYAYECCLIAEALLYDYVHERGRPRTGDGGIGITNVRSTEDVARSIANIAADAVFEKLSHSAGEKP